MSTLAREDHHVLFSVFCFWFLNHVSFSSSLILHLAFWSRFLYSLLMTLGSLFLPASLPPIFPPNPKYRSKAIWDSWYPVQSLSNVGTEDINFLPRIWWFCLFFNLPIFLLPHLLSPFLHFTPLWSSTWRPPPHFAFLFFIILYHVLFFFTIVGCQHFLSFVFLYHV